MKRIGVALRKCNSHQVEYTTDSHATYLFGLSQNRSLNQRDCYNDRSHCRTMNTETRSFVTMTSESGRCELS